MNDIALIIRQANAEDFVEILRIYAHARSYMKESGNPTQWGEQYPPEELVRDDIKKQQLYVGTVDGKIHFVFVFFLEPEPDYAVIEDGAWLSDEPYGTIHRVASDGVVPGAFGRSLAYCKSVISHIRMDTHRDNTTMQHVLEKQGFVHCGTISVEDGSKRMAYELCG